MKISISEISEGYRWVLETGPDECLMDSGRESDLHSCIAAIERSMDELLGSIRG